MERSYASRTINCGTFSFLSIDRISSIVKLVTKNLVKKYGAFKIHNFWSPKFFLKEKSVYATEIFLFVGYSDIVENKEIGNCRACSGLLCIQTEPTDYWTVIIW